MTATPDKLILWIADKAFLPAEWPLLSRSYKVQSELPEAALEALRHGSFAAILVHCEGDPGPAGLFERLQAAAAGVPILIHAPFEPAPGNPFFSSETDAISAIERAMGRNADSLSAEIAARADWKRLLLGESQAMRQVRHTIRVVGARRSTVLVTGETGTGKELAARSLHLAGPRRRGPWVAVNCSALPENLLEAELFGHVKGAFTGAIQSRPGRFEEAQGGTLFLDEIGDLAPGLQAKLLRVVQEREVQRLGTSDTIRLDIRLVAATNCDLAHRVEEGRFREDLYYRLNVVPLEMPALRRRPDDIPLLAEHFVQKICRLEKIACKRLAADAAEHLARYSWPGNVRQLENAVEMAVALSAERLWLDVHDFPLPVGPIPLPQASAGPMVALPDQGMDYEQTVARIERSILQQALAKTGGNKKAAADMLGLKRTTLSAKVRSLAPVAACS